jgi:hypothetical protein
LEERLQVTFSTLILTYWARQELKIDPGFAPLAGNQVRDLFKKVRGGQKKPPYRLADHEKVFVQTFSGYAWGLNAERETDWREPLSRLWRGFAEEYAMVKAADLDPKFVKYILVITD